jgi:2-oxoglutarate dehydrogenase E2 component (dihydrolipoamide succinyltransferase)
MCWSPFQPGTQARYHCFFRDEKREKMSNLRKTVSRRLVEAKNTTAMLTTFNEVDMGKIMASARPIRISSRKRMA